jgi:DNA-binding transcriptional LysR family regulator
MDRAALVPRIWPWLPAFRAIAESEHLPTAARRLHVVPSALSRTLGLLEEALGERLFTRTGRRLALNARGRALLEAVRAGEEAIARGAAHATAVEGEAVFAGELRVGTLGVLTNHVVLPELLALVDAHPQLVPILRNARSSEANHRLALGDLDVAFYYDALTAPGLAIRRLGILTNGIYCGRAHPLFRARRVDRARLLAYPFSVTSVVPPRRNPRPRGAAPPAARMRYFPWPPLPPLPSAGATSFATWTTTTVMLSSPPRSLAISTRRRGTSR